MGKRKSGGKLGDVCVCVYVLLLHSHLLEQNGLLQRHAVLIDPRNHTALLIIPPKASRARAKVDVSVEIDTGRVADETACLRAYVLAHVLEMA